MVLSYDVGSTPFPGDFERFSNGLSGNEVADRNYFEEKIMEGFVDKVRVGISIPNYPQFRDMNAMFLNSINGIAKAGSGYKVIDEISLSKKKLRVPEIAAVEAKSKEICERVGNPFAVKICVTGPYTLSSLFDMREAQLFTELGTIMSEFIASNLFNNKFGKVVLVSVDEPVFGIIDDPLLDFGSGGREELLSAWDTVFHEIGSRGLQSILHLHNTSNGLFWQVKSLNVVESHVGDSLYKTPQTRARLEETDKFLKASICVTDFDTLIRQTEALNACGAASLGQKVADAWTSMKRGSLDPASFLESTDTMSDRLKTMIRQYGDRVLYAGPECGLRSFPSYDSAMECLRRIGKATNLSFGQ